MDEYIEHIYPLFEYPEEIREIIYTINLIESLNGVKEVKIGEVY